MKYPFNKERAMKGDPVVTRDGRKTQYVKELDNNKMHCLLFKIDGCEPTTFTEEGQWCFGENDKRDLFMLTPDPAPSAPIPFDWDKYNSGEWDAVYRDETKPAAIYYTPEAKIWKLVSIDKQGDSLTHRQDGSSSISGKENNYDLLLTPKQVTRWFTVFEQKGKLEVVVEGESDDIEKIAKMLNGRYIGTYSFTTNAKP